MLNFKRLGVRLILSYAALLSLFVLVLSLAIGQVQKMAGLSARLAGKEMQTLLLVQQLSGATENVGRVLLQLLTVDRSQRIAEYQAVDEKNREIDKLIAKLEILLTEDSQRQLLKILQEKRNRYQAHFLDNVNLLEDQGQDQAKAYFVKMVQPTLHELLIADNNFLAGQQSQLLQQQQQAQSEIQQISQIIIVLSFFAVLLAMLFAWLFTRSIAGPLESLKTHARHIATGNYSANTESGEIEEIKQVAVALNTMSTTIAEREQAIQHLAYYDKLTDLPNRAQLLQNQEIARAPGSGLLMMDLARLKTINQTLGFDTGDTIIKQTAQRLRDHFSEQAAQHRLARLNGGSFALLLLASDSDQITAYRQQIEALMADPVTCSGHLVDVNCVIGACFSGPHEWRLEQLLRNAEIALYTAKRSNQKYAFYSDAQEAYRLSHLSLLSDLRMAVKSDQLQLWLQPKIKLSDNTCYGFEALVRWQHPQRGFISPAEFIPFAEQTGYISLITDWMVEQALQKLASWRKQYPQLSIAVNLSTQDLRDPHFDQKLAHLLQRYEIAPALLRLEITESGLMDDPAASLLVLGKLHDLGLALSIDDFGTGYSSLAYLQKLPVNELKIDRSFVSFIEQDTRLQNLVAAIIQMGQGLGLHVIAEGIERIEEKLCLQGLGCDAMQGYLASKPLHGEALQNWLDNAQTYH